MNEHNSWLAEQARNIHSQCGEDGILGKILERLPDRSNWCVEFGAWDGLHHSNTAHLIRSGDFRAVMIEADPTRFAELKRTYPDPGRVHAVSAFVGFGPHDGLDVILRSTPIPTDFDILSIDIDGNDYHVWSAVQMYSPKCVVIEYNPTVPTGVHFVQPADPNLMQGASIDALVALGTKKGYELVAITRYNGIFVRSEYFPRFDIKDNSISALRTDQTFVTHVFCGYDGTVFVRGCGRLPWHDVPFITPLMQPLPRIFRSWVETYGPVRARMFGLYRRGMKAINRRLSPPPQRSE